jgi:hypothetical protein
MYRQQVTPRICQTGDSCPHTDSFFESPTFVGLSVGLQTTVCPYAVDFGEK